MTGTPLIVRNLTKTFLPEKKGSKAFTAVNNVSFELKQGQILGLLGPNGAGKTTTISMLLSSLSPTSGTIQYFGKEFPKHKSEVLQHVTFASTYIRMPWRLTVLENLRIYALLYGVEGRVFDDRLKRFMDFFGVWDQRHKTMSMLSAGQITRIMLVKAFLPYPKIVLLDEPTASLDPDIAHEVRKFVKLQRKEHGVSILYTSHNMDEVTDVCDEVMFLKGGKILAVDRPENLARSVRFARMRLLVEDGLKRTVKFAQAHLGRLLFGDEQSMKIHRIKAVILRHLYPLQRDFDLLSDMIYWPMVDTLLWGITSQWLSEAAGQANILVSILMALLMWNAIWRSQMEVSRNLIDEIWNNNLVNLFTTPLKLREWLVSIGLLSLLKTAFTLTLVTIVIRLMYFVNIFYFGWWLVMFLAAMIMTGWWVGFLSAGIVIRFGPKMQTVVWTLPGMLLPFSAVFFPLERFPAVLQAVSQVIPTTYVFEAMRSLAAGGGVQVEQLVFSFGLNALYLLLAILFFTKSFKKSVSLGLGRFN